MDIGAGMAGKNRFDEDLLGRLPLSPASFFVLFALAEGQKHGYRIMQDVRELSEGTFSLGPATLYTTIKKLTEQDLISELSSSAEDRRRNYVLTSAGWRLLSAEFHRQQALLNRARSKGLVKFGGKK
jgi:DNA-binding PadR family transcriptional regulator